MPTAKNSLREFEVLAECDVSAAVDAAIRDLLGTCFPADASVFAKNRAWHDSSPAYSVLCCIRGRIVGHLGMVFRTIRCGSVETQVAGVQNLCVEPAHRGTGISHELMQRALAEAKQRGVSFGLLFCVPKLERLYAAQGWQTIDTSVTMLDERGSRVSLPAKNIAMVCELGTSAEIPPGPIDLLGRDW